MRPRDPKGGIQATSCQFVELSARQPRGQETVLVREGGDAARFVKQQTDASDSAVAGRLPALQLPARCFMRPNSSKRPNPIEGHQPSRFSSLLNNTPGAFRRRHLSPSAQSRHQTTELTDAGEVRRKQVHEPEYGEHEYARDEMICSSCERFRRPSASSRHGRDCPKFR